MCDDPKFPINLNICYWLQRDRNWDCEFEEKEKDFEQKTLLILKWQKYKGVTWNIAQYLLSGFEDYYWF